jgi:hypothetical protein
VLLGSAGVDRGHESVQQVETRGRLARRSGAGPAWPTPRSPCADGSRAGSRALRDWIARRRPRLALHGHVHEAPDTLGGWAEHTHDTTYVNPGAFGENGPQAVVGELRGTDLSLRHTTRAEIAGRWEETR